MPLGMSGPYFSSSQVDSLSVLFCGGVESPSDWPCCALVELFFPGFCLCLLRFFFFVVVLLVVVYNGVGVGVWPWSVVWGGGGIVVGGWCIVCGVSVARLSRFDWWLLCGGWTSLLVLVLSLWVDCWWFCVCVSILRSVGVGGG